MDEREEARAEAAGIQDKAAPGAGAADGNPAGDGGHKNPTKGRRICGIAAAAIAAALIGATCWVNATTPPAGSGGGGGATAARQATEDGEPEGMSKITLDYSAEGYADDSTPVIVRVTGTTDDGGDVDYYHAFTPEEILDGAAVLDVDPGAYGVEVLPSLNADGSMNAGTDGAVEPVSDAGGGATTVRASETADGPAAGTVTLEAATTPAGDVTDADLEALMERVGEATSNGDGSLSGDAGESVLEAYGQIAGTVDGDPDGTDADAGDPAADDGSDTGATATEGGATGTGGTGSGGGSGTSGSPSGSGSGPSSNGSSSGSGGSGGASTAHAHTWTAVTERKWVQDSAAWDEPVYTTEEVQETKAQCQCGAIFDNSTALGSHMKSYYLAGDTTGHNNYHVIYVTTGTRQVQTGTVHHEATGHYETVTTGYRCSTCGATK